MVVALAYEPEVTEGVKMPHVPVMVDEVLEHLMGAGAKSVLDGTVGAGGHAEAILRANGDVTLIGIDRDPHALDLARHRLECFGDRVRLVHGLYDAFDNVLTADERVDAMFLDLGVSSMQLDQPDRGFSYATAGPLDMRMSGDGRPASELLRHIGVEALAGVLREFGEVRRPRRIARRIQRAVDEGVMQSTTDLRGAVRSAVGAAATPAELSRVFQALRIAVNGELNLLSSFLAGAISHLSPGGRLVIISYHSLEDRMVKSFFKKESTMCLCPPEVPICVCGHVARLRVLTRRPMKPSASEISSNKRSRSARLRAAELMAEEATN